MLHILTFDRLAVEIKQNLFDRFLYQSAVRLYQQTLPTKLELNANTVDANLLAICCQSTDIPRTVCLLLLMVHLFYLVEVYICVDFFTIIDWNFPLLIFIFVRNSESKLINSYRNKLVLKCQKLIFNIVFYLYDYCEIL